MTRTVIALLFGIASAIVAGVSIVVGLLVGLWIGIPLGIFVGLLVVAAVPTAFVFSSRCVLGIPEKPGLTLLWFLVALSSALLYQLLTGKLLAVSPNPYASPVVVVMAAVLIATAVAVFGGSEVRGRDRDKVD